VERELAAVKTPKIRWLIDHNRGPDGTLTPVAPLAKLEIYCSRPHAPTRRVALGASDLPCDPGPGYAGLGYGGVLLGGVVARFVGDLDPESLSDITSLSRELEQGHRISQPRLRYRLQIDTVGLSAVTHQLLSSGEEIGFDFDESGAPAQQVLGALYAAGAMEPSIRRPAMVAIRRAINWQGLVGADLIATLSGMRAGMSGARMAVGNPTVWALAQLGLEPAPTTRDVQRRYREMLRDVHPDHGAEVEGAAQRIAELSEARRILTGR